MFKAALNGPNRRRNRVGDATVASVPEQKSVVQEAPGIPFPVQAFETAPASVQSNLAGRHACLLSCGGPCGQGLLQKHQELVGNSDEDFPILIHFHDIVVLVLRAIPLMDDYSDTLYLSEVHRHNHKVCEDTVYSITCCSLPEANRDYDEISAVHVEVSLRHIDEDEDDEEDPVAIDAKNISKQLMSSTYRSVLTAHELILIDSGDVELVCRIAEIRIKESEQESSGLSVEEATLDDPFRGRVVVDTEFYISKSAGSSSLLELEGERPFPKGRLPSDVVHITTRDGEWFPVRRLLLAPCLQLTRCVQAGRGKYKDEIPMLSDEDRSEDAPTDDGCPHAKVDMDCHTFDRVLLYLTSLLYPKTTKFVPELSEINALADAADSLGLQSLSDLCRAQLSTFDSRVRRDSYIPYSEVVSRNEQGGELLLILDGMVLDITRWIDEHPGGPSIIPTQALNVDATVFFEMYHVSRQAFIYLKSFYIGELRPEDYAAMLESDTVQASEAFLQSLRSFTKEWRVQIEQGEAEKIHKSL